VTQIVGTCALSRTTFEACERASRNTREASGQCGSGWQLRPENFAATAPFAGRAGWAEAQKSTFYGAFRDGTALADP
jgi:hypothetical protein